MIKALFHSILYKPLYNALVLFTLFTPGNDVGFAIILLTIFVRVLLLPLSHRAVRTQSKMREIEPLVRKVREDHATDREAQAKKMLELYREHGVNPFSSFFLLIVQLPILIALYWVVQGGLPFHATDLYGFLHLPENANVIFLGLIDLTKGSIPLAVIVGLSQHLQVRLSMPAMPIESSGKTPGLGESITRSMQLNMKYVMPAVIALVSAGLPAAIALYWLTSNIFMIGHELVVRKKAQKIVSSQ